MSEGEGVRAIDCWVNPHTPALAGAQQPEFLVCVATDYFHRQKELARGTPLDEMVAMMEAAGIEAGILTLNSADPKPYAEMAAKYPGRFLLSTVVDPLQGMEAVRTIDALVKEYDVRLIRMVPFLFNRPPNDKVCYPIYTKCIELGVAVSVNTGIPGPPIPGEVQNPIHLDRVCVRFPELRLCMIHGADPWWDTAIRLMLKYKNLRLMTSAWSPKRLPQSLLHYMTTRGKEKIMFASDYPVLSMQRCLGEAQALDLPEDVLEGWLHGNANAFFWGED